MRAIATTIIFSIFCLQGNSIFAQVQPTETVFLIGENEDFYHNLTGKYQTSLLEVCENSMDISYETWSNLMKQIEKFCFDNQMDIRGTKLWMNIFWNEAGTIDYIVYHPKPNSKKLDYNIVTDLLKEFITTGYTLNIKTGQNFSHYGSTSFPVFTYNNLVQEK